MSYSYAKGNPFTFDTPFKVSGGNCTCNPSLDAKDFWLKTGGANKKTSAKNMSQQKGSGKKVFGVLAALGLARHYKKKHSKGKKTTKPKKHPAKSKTKGGSSKEQMAQQMGVLRNTLGKARNVSGSKRGGGSDWGYSNRSRGPINYPDNEPRFRAFNKTDAYVPNNELLYKVAPISTGAQKDAFPYQGSNADKYSVFESVGSNVSGGAKKKTAAAKGMKKKTSTKKTTSKKTASTKKTASKKKTTTKGKKTSTKGKKTSTKGKKTSTKGKKTLTKSVKNLMSKLF